MNAKSLIKQRESKRIMLEKYIADILKELGEDPKREGLQKTPERFAKALKYLTEGYELNPKTVVNGAIYHEKYSEMVIVRNIELFSLCEHHILPFFGKAHIAYIPNGKIIGLSKIPRLVDVFARRLQVQERMTEQISQALNQLLEPHGVGVVIEAFHLCMMMRGVEKQNSYTITSSMLGSFREDPRTRKEFIDLISRDKVLT